MIHNLVPLLAEMFPKANFEEGFLEFWNLSDINFYCNKKCRILDIEIGSKEADKFAVEGAELSANLQLETLLLRTDPDIDVDLVLDTLRKIFVTHSA
jgi:hypothetical protein